MVANAGERGSPQDASPLGSYQSVEMGGPSPGQAYRREARRQALAETSPSLRVMDCSMRTARSTKPSISCTTTIRSTSAIGGIHRLENPGKNLLELIEFDQKKNKPSREIGLDSP